MPTNLQLANMFTKGLSNSIFQTLVGKLGIENIYSPTSVGVLKEV